MRKAILKLLKKWHLETCQKCTEGKNQLSNSKHLLIGPFGAGQLLAWPIVLLLSKYFLGTVCVPSTILDAPTQNRTVKNSGAVKTIGQRNWITILICERINEVFKWERHTWMVWLDIAKSKQWSDIHWSAQKVVQLFYLKKVVLRSQMIWILLQSGSVNLNVQVGQCINILNVSHWGGVGAGQNKLKSALISRVAKNIYP